MSRSIRIECVGTRKSPLRKGSAPRALREAVTRQTAALQESGQLPELLPVLESAAAAANKLIPRAAKGSVICVSIAIQEDPCGAGWSASVLVDATEN